MELYATPDAVNYEQRDSRGEGRLSELIKRLTDDPPNTLDLQRSPSVEYGQLTDSEDIS